MMHPSPFWRQSFTFGHKVVSRGAAMPIRWIQDDPHDDS